MKVILSVLVFLLASCSTMDKTLVVTGESLKGLGTEFVQVAAAYKNGCDVAKTIPASQCASFKSFGVQFQKSYPLTVQLWEAARSANDVAMQAKIGEVISSLAASLSTFAVSVITTVGSK